MVSSPRKAEGDAPAPIRWMRAGALAGYIGVVVLCFVSPWGPRVLWTMLVPLLPLFVVLVGFHTWRLVCPLALIGSVGTRLQTGSLRIRRALGLKPRPGDRPARRVPAWIEKWFFVVTLGFLMLMLVCRLVLINGDGRWLGLTLIALGALAAATNFAYTGKTWCNFLCPVGVVERIYTDPQLRPAGGSKCGACTACKKNCPDIDQENAYWKDVLAPPRRIAFYAFPGVVLAFYAYTWLRDGRWDRYLDGSWVRTAASVRLAFGPGFFFLPRVPAVAAASLTMLILAVASYSLFDLVECLAVRWVPDAERRRHKVLMLAAFTAFNLFYIFAGPPSLLGVPGAVQAMAFAVPVISTWALARRWPQTSEGFAQARSARRLIPLWTLDTPPPRDPAALLAFFKGQEHARGAQLNAYRDILQDLLADGAIRSRDLRLLDRLRAELGIGDGDHGKLVAALPEAQRLLLEAKQAARAEKLARRDTERQQAEGEQAPHRAEQAPGPGDRLPARPARQWLGAGGGFAMARLAARALRALLLRMAHATGMW